MITSAVQVVVGQAWSLTMSRVCSAYAFPGREGEYAIDDNGRGGLAAGELDSGVDGDVTARGKRDGGADALDVSGPVGYELLDGEVWVIFSSKGGRIGSSGETEVLFPSDDVT